MKILILGASSNIGTALAVAFSLGNNLILAGRNVDRLVRAVARCKQSGAAEAKYVEVDFRYGIAPLLGAIAGRHIDLIIDAASASSSKRDSELAAGDIPSLVAVDFISRTGIFDYIISNQDTAPAVIFISTVLALVDSPDRTDYTTLKKLYGAYLIKLKESHQELHLLVVYVGIIVEREGTPHGAERLAVATAKSFHNRDNRLLYGTAGRFVVGLYYLQPLTYWLFTITQRKVRRLFTPRA